MIHTARDDTIANAQEKDPYAVDKIGPTHTKANWCHSDIARRYRQLDEFPPGTDENYVDRFRTKASDRTYKASE